MSQAELARRAGTSQAAISKLEAGVVSPSVSTLDGLLTALGERLELSAVTLGGRVDDDELARFRALSEAERLAEAFAAAEFATALHGGAARAR